jgi:hypothetical protein
MRALVDPSTTREETAGAQDAGESLQLEIEGSSPTTNEV